MTILNTFTDNIITKVAIVIKVKYSTVEIIPALNIFAVKVMHIITRQPTQSNYLLYKSIIVGLVCM